MAKVQEVKLYDEDGNLYVDQLHYWCLGCGYEHAFSPNVHKFNGDFDNPTVTPSLLHTGEFICHSFIKDGKIQYLSDCYHSLKGQTVELPDIDIMIAKMESRNINIKNERYGK